MMRVCFQTEHSKSCHISCNRFRCVLNNRNLQAELLLQPLTKIFQMCRLRLPRHLQSFDVIWWIQKNRMHSKMTWTYLNNWDDSLQKHKEIEWSQSDSLTVWQFDLKHFVSKCPAEVVPLRRTCCASSSSASCSPRSDQKHNESILDPLTLHKKRGFLDHESTQSFWFQEFQRCQS